MPRTARHKGEFQTYHIIQRGNERKNLFISEEDRVRFLDTLARMRDKYNFKLEAYCLMDNHVHLLIHDNGNDISKVVKSINISYAYYFNRKYKRVGHLFQDRFKSELIDNDSYLLSVSAYIHNNPVKAAVVKTPQEYKWSSFNHYMGKEKNRSDLVETERILNIFSQSKSRAMGGYYNYVLKYEAQSDIIDVEEDTLVIKKENGYYMESVGQARVFIDKELQEMGKRVEDLAEDKGMRRELAIKLRRNSSLTLKEIGELVGGISSSMVCKMLKNQDSI